MFILHALSKYNPEDSREAEAIAERVTPRLAHANSAVVLSTIRVTFPVFTMLPLPVRLTRSSLIPKPGIDEVA